jgi:hypothetical protein
MQHDPALKKPFRSAFSAATYNLGPQTVCKPHVDFANVPFGMCAVTALGTFDSKKGGQLVLWDCRLIVEFPSGATILLPSAIVTHSNLPIQKGEKRYSFAQYTAGGLMRWVNNGFQTWKKYSSQLGEERAKGVQEKREGQWEYGLGLLGVI